MVTKDKLFERTKLFRKLQIARLNIVDRSIDEYWSSYDPDYEAERTNGLEPIDAFKK